MPEKCYPCTCTNLLPMYPDYTSAQSNNAMQPTANSVDFIRETPAIRRFVAAADGGRYVAT
jgi:hypothetical protein